MNIEPFSLPYSDAAVEDLGLRLSQTRWLDEIPGSGWEYGVDLDFIRQLCAYWKDHFDWKAQVETLSAFHHYRCTLDGIGIHFIHERGKGPAPIPLVLTHGWPGSFLEMLKIIPLLTDPASHGGDPAVSFDVVVPSLPGFGFSDRPTKRGMNTFRMGELWVALMAELGYERFAAQGGDFGAAVSTILGLRHPQHVVGVHLNYIPGSYRPYLEPGTKLDHIEPQFLDFLADPEKVKTFVEGERLGYGHLFNPVFATETSLIDPLPHQKIAVYEHMLPQSRLRFLLADDAGAGKTIMAGLLIKELLIRGDLERCLIVAPGSLVEQWQDEMSEKFGLGFDILTRDQIEASITGNPFVEEKRLNLAARHGGALGRVESDTASGA